MITVTGCRHWTEEAGYCTHQPTRPYLPGPRCRDHTPARLAGRADHTPDPTLTLDGIRAAQGLVYHYLRHDTQLIDDRAIASGRRRSNTRTYRDAKAAEAARKAKA